MTPNPAAPMFVTPIPDGFRLTVRVPMHHDIRWWEQELNRVALESPKRVELDLAKTEYISSLAIGVLIAFGQRIKAAGGNVQIIKIHKFAYDVLHTSRLTQMFQIAPGAIVGDTKR